jgi:hypothetical protein
MPQSKNTKLLPSQSKDALNEVSNDVSKDVPIFALKGGRADTSPTDTRAGVAKQPPKPPPQPFQPIPGSISSFNLWQRADNKLNANLDTQPILQAAYSAPTAELGEEL